MHNRDRLLSRYFVVILLTVLLGACATLGPYKEPPRVSLASIQPKEMGLLEQRYGLQLRILNPNDTAIPLEGLSYTIEINDREFAYGVSRQSVSIPAYGEALLDVDVVSNLLNVLRQVQEMGTENRSSLKYRLSGKMNLTSWVGSLPFDYQGELNYLPADTAAP